MSIRPTTVSAAALAAFATLIVTVLPVPAQADGVRSSACVGSFFGGFSCTTTWRRGLSNPHIVKIPMPTSDLDVSELDARDRLWLDRCRPNVHHDQFGVARYQYAAPNCEYGRIY